MADADKRKKQADTLFREKKAQREYNAAGKSNGPSNNDIISAEKLTKAMQAENARLRALRDARKKTEDRR